MNTRSDKFLSTKAWRRMRDEVLRRDGYRCQFNGVRCDGRGITAGHIIARRHGGRDTLANLAASCWYCQNQTINGVRCEPVVHSQPNPFVKRIPRDATPVFKDVGALKRRPSSFSLPQTGGIPPKGPNKRGIFA